MVVRVVNLAQLSFLPRLTLQQAVFRLAACKLLTRPRLRHFENVWNFSESLGSGLVFTLELVLRPVSERVWISNSGFLGVFYSLLKAS
ncbi:uncharacterized [Tachysurus ichikawai]